MKILQFLKKNHFVLLLIAAFLAADMVLEAKFDPYIINSGHFYCNDYELTRRAHPEEVWDKVFFGNSVAISAYREESSQSGYINLGLDYGVVRDLWEMVDQGIITLGSELVLGLNDLTLYDKFETNPSYPWHREIWEPYAYFQRDNLKQYLDDMLKAAATGQQMVTDAHRLQHKSFYYGSLTSDELAEKVATSQYFHLPLEDFQENLEAMEKLAAYCRENGTRLRVVWMPVNPQVELSEESRAVYYSIEALCREEGLEFLDLEDALEPACFYDIGHLNNEYGTDVFTALIDPWLMEEN